MDHTDSKKNELKAEKAFKVSETFKLVEPPKEAKVSKMDVSHKVVDPCLLAKTTMDGASVEEGHHRRSLLQLPQAAVKSVSMLMASALQSGWQMCSWKVSTMSPLSPTAPPFPPRSPLLIHACGNVKWLWPLRKNGLVTSYQTKHAIIVWTGDCTLGHLSQINKNLCSHKNLYMMFIAA